MKWMSWGIFFFLDTEYTSSLVLTNTHQHVHHDLTATTAMRSHAVSQLVFLLTDHGDFQSAGRRRSSATFSIRYFYTRNSIRRRFTFPNHPRTEWSVQRIPMEQQRWCCGEHAKFQSGLHDFFSPLLSSCITWSSEKIWVWDLLTEHIVYVRRMLFLHPERMHG